MPASPPASPPPAAPPRRPGRPAAGKAATAGQRGQLLDAATTLFARQGVAATPIKTIAAHAGVTPALVHYYFRDRDQLLDAVVDERLQPLVEHVFAPALADLDDPTAMLVGIATRLIRAAAATPWFPGLWIREIVNAEGQLHERVLQKIALQRAGLVTAHLSAARAAGQLNPGVEPALLMVSLIGLTLLPLATTHIWQRLPGAREIDPEALARHVSALLAHGMSPLPAAPGPSA
ncbi:MULTISPECIES: TetR/AcrR family transcriptional regulator [Cupriavidus]